jgi:hypothetical protein
VQGLDELVDKDTQDLVLSRQLGLGMTTIVISSHAGKAHEAPPIVYMPGALGLLVHADGQVRYYQGARPDRQGSRSGMSDRDHDDACADTYDGRSESNSEYFSDSGPGAKKPALSVAGQAGKVIKSGFKGIRKAGRMLGRTVAQAPSLLPVRSTSTDSH